MLYKSNLLTLLKLLDIVAVVLSIIYGPKWPFYSCDDILACLGQVYAGFVIG